MLPNRKNHEKNLHTTLIQRQMLQQDLKAIVKSRINIRQTIRSKKNELAELKEGKIKNSYLQQKIDSHKDILTLDPSSLSNVQDEIIKEVMKKIQEEIIVLKNGLSFYKEIKKKIKLEISKKTLLIEQIKREMQKEEPLLQNPHFLMGLTFYPNTAKQPSPPATPAVSSPSDSNPPTASQNSNLSGSVTPPIQPSDKKNSISIQGSQETAADQGKSQPSVTSNPSSTGAVNHSITPEQIEKNKIGEDNSGTSPQPSKQTVAKQTKSENSVTDNSFPTAISTLSFGKSFLIAKGEAGEQATSVELQSSVNRSSTGIGHSAVNKDNSDTSSQESKQPLTTQPGSEDFTDHLFQTAPSTLSFGQSFLFAKEESKAKSSEPFTSVELQSSGITNQKHPSGSDMLSMSSSDNQSDTDASPQNTVPIAQDSLMQNSHTFLGTPKQPTAPKKSLWGKLLQVGQDMLQASRSEDHLNKKKPPQPSSPRKPRH